MCCFSVTLLQDKTADFLSNDTGCTFCACIRRIFYFHSFVAICKAQYVANVKVEAVETVARWSVIDKSSEFLSCA